MNTSLPSFPKNLKKYLFVVSVLSFIAMLITVYLTYMHFKPDAASVCDFNDKFNCDIVNKSPWSVIDLGFLVIPVSILGFGTYVILFLASTGVVYKWETWAVLNSKKLIDGMILLSAIGVVFSLYLTYIEAFVLFTYCIFCVAQQVIIAIILGLLIAVRMKMAKHVAIHLQK